ncbi:acyl-CoA dehydrogenase family protein [Rhodalgimonas zhirmunskyi]|uniref:Acyl-CoA dehydrogenase family protein n=1 Tax=Rhodalgimonas zhirmunskyi TaxID=2964767 RepID=A0AAJ1U3B1_9RHOB|nr:acyl-CoA dehydrogenase family protein [Rhodoalgimonas zhirmunskyi]MDQ2092905.1 acyl-CoA dehydrogenase family protein [Rhodoalgimonas zhirmunskyi]
MTHSPPQIAPRSHLPTHEVENQPAARTGADLWQTDPMLRHYAQLSGADQAALRSYGARMGSADLREAGAESNRVPPKLETFDRTGRRIDEVRFHPGYHALMQTSLTAGFSAAPWEGETKAGHSQHVAMVYMASQVEPGHTCPLVMTYAAVPALAANAPALAATWGPKLTARAYDTTIAPIGRKSAATMGMAMTEKQGGSDVRANTTRAVADPASGEGAYRLRGHKWFCSAPMCDGFLTLAQAPEGLTCFLVPRWLEGERNAIQIMRLKEKLGNRANASSEIEYHDALAYRVGDAGRGVKTIIEMVHHTRLGTSVAPAGLMRGALAEAKYWVEGRRTFQRRLIDQPMMRAVLADLALDLEGTAALAFRLGRAFDSDSDADRAFARIAVALAKFLGNKLCPNVIYEAMECLGGVGYTDDTPLPMLFRESPLNSIWEGSGNVICLDVMRALARDQAAREALQNALAAVAGESRAYDAALATHLSRWPGLPDEGEARWFVESLATLLTAATLLTDAPAAVAGGYIATRLGETGRGRVYGAVSGLETDAILERL